ncbi:hypothetical protein B296_00033398 [Ensete ventricosum]|uniref:Uncharacterized protein n=1 Tax=Ensete ventricosum TaxID=4639 RepID=A0A426YE16_ENSVE|nr:hypothetical protein B296_00033398 [Ensete ventricosum]
MLPLRFPNSGIIAKVFMRKIRFKLRVMRLNRLELFYTFLVYFYAKHSEERGGRPRPKPLAGATASWRSHAARGDCPFRGRKGQPRSQGCLLQGQEWPLAQGGDNDNLVRVREEG